MVLAFLIVVLAPFGKGLTAESLEQPYRFDAGGATVQTAKDAVRLVPSDRYGAEKGYGWLKAPDSAFVRLDLSRSRSDFTIDGVVASELSFRADLRPGRWWLTLWLEAGTEDSSTVSLKINEKPIELAWQSFRPPAEPRAQLQKAYRVYHGAIMSSASGASFSLTGGRDLVRLLGFSLTPDVPATTPAQQALLQRLKKLGRYARTDPLDGVLDDLEEMTKQGPRAAFATYWTEQVNLLREAEKHFALRGWEWAREKYGLSIFDRFHQAVMILDGLLDRPDPENYPLYERALWLRGRLLYWLAEERHGEHEIAGARRDLSSLLGKYPDDPLLTMYNGKRVDSPDHCDDLVATAGAPAWSRAQRELLCRHRQIVHWWVTQRQAPNGEFGGKLGDDVELLRWWTPLVLTGDSIAYVGWKKLADCVWEHRKVYRGYSRAAIDVEHSSEFISDTAPAMALYSDDEEYTDRLRYSADYFKNLWTGISEKGHRFFRSAWFSSTQVDTTPPKNRDVEYNCRAVKAVRYLAWKTRDPAVIEPLHQWSQAWVSAALRTDKNKPPGIIPASVRFPDEAINGNEFDWFRANMFWDYFDWDHHAGSLILEQLLFTYTLTGDESLLQPLFAALELVRTHTSDQSSSNGARTAGSPAWAAEILRRKKGFWSVVGQWRLMSDNHRYDDLILRYGTPYVRYRLTGNEKHLLAGLEKALESVRYNTPLLTSEVLHTDRVYVQHSEHLKAMLTGDGIPESSSPYYAVSWEDTDETFTALVTDARSSRLSLKLFSHSHIPREVTARLWQLAPGDYVVQYPSQHGERIEKRFKMSEAGQRLSLTLPPKTLLTVSFEAE